MMNEDTIKILSEEIKNQLQFDHYIPDSNNDSVDQSASDIDSSEDEIEFQDDTCCILKSPIVASMSLQKMDTSEVNLEALRPVFLNRENLHSSCKKLDDENSDDFSDSGFLPNMDSPSNIDDHNIRKLDNSVHEDADYCGTVVFKKNLFEKTPTTQDNRDRCSSISATFTLNDTKNHFDEKP